MLLELLRTHAAERPDGIAVIEADGTAVRFSELVSQAEAVARWLEAEGVDRFAVQTTSLPDLLAVLAGASLVGAEPCAYRADLSGDDLVAMLERFEHRVLLGPSDPPTVATRAVPIAEARLEAGDLPPAADQSPLLVLTTGTTGVPKGARHDWRRLLAAAGGRKPAPGTRWLFAYNPYQFAGVQMLVHVLSVGGVLVVPTSNRPRDALEAMRVHAVTHVSATPTFWRFLLAGLRPGDTSALALQQITLGGEAVGERVLEELHVAFPEVPISQIYAATEFGSAVSVRDGDIGLPASVLERGPDADVRFKIVDDELWVSSRVGMTGYFGDDRSGGSGEAEWRPTGDRVELRDDRIVFLGRTSETINVGGVKVHPLPIEDAIARVPGVQLVRVFGRKNPMTGQIVAAEVVAAPDVDTGALEVAIKEACSAGLPTAARPRRIRFVDSLEMRGDKLARGVAAAEERSS
jgi:acyl-CoA synthetase (AMP-forming)/AMP-acid ligase II